MSNSILYNSSAGGYGEHLLLSFFLSLICAALIIILIARRLLVALSLASHPVETRTAILAAPNSFQHLHGAYSFSISRYILPEQRNSNEWDAGLAEALRDYRWMAGTDRDVI